MRFSDGEDLASERKLLDPPKHAASRAKPGIGASE